MPMYQVNPEYNQPQLFGYWETFNQSPGTVGPFLACKEFYFITIHTSEVGFKSKIRKHK